jgi:NIPSNAP
MPQTPITCEVRYRLDRSRMAEFEAYARIWVGLIERHGGTHHGYFVPSTRPAGSILSHPAAGTDGDGDVAIALFSFPDEASYQRYRIAIASDPDGIEANARFGPNPPFVSYERNFLTRLA